MAFGAGIGDADARFLEELASCLIGETCLRVWIMAVCADRRICVSGRQRFLMDAVQCFLILVSMTFLTGCVHLQREIAWTACRHFGVREPRDICMAVHTGNFFRPVDRGREMTSIDGDWNGLP